MKKNSTFVALALIAVQVAPAIAGGKCFDGPLSVDGHDVPKETLLKSVVGLFFDGADKAVASDEEFKSFMQSRGQCQFTCVEKTVTRAASTLYGKCGKDFGSKECENLSVESLTGAFMACFPSAPRDSVHKSIVYILDNMGKTTPKGKPDLDKANKQCKNKAAAENADIDAFTRDFGKAFKDVVDAKPGVKKFFEEEALGCQKECLEDTIPTAALYLEMTGNQDKHEILQAVTGAARACFPGVPRADVKDLMAAVIGVFEDNEGKTTRLFSLKPGGALTIVPAKTNMAFGVFCGVAVVTSFAVVMRRRWQATSVETHELLEIELKAEQGVVE